MRNGNQHNKDAKEREAGLSANTPLVREDDQRRTHVRSPATNTACMPNSTRFQGFVVPALEIRVSKAGLPCSQKTWEPNRNVRRVGRSRRKTKESP